MNVNIMQLLQLIRTGRNPQQIIQNILQQNNNPILKNAMTLAQGGNISALEMLARNLAQQKGLDFDKEFANFQNSLK